MPKQFLRTVTITGADDRVDPDALVSLSREFPFVEWAILLNGTGGKSRFPSSNWLEKVEHLWTDLLVSPDTLPRFAGHLSGQLVRDIVATAEFSAEIDMFDRIQFNLKSCNIINEAFLDELVHDEWTQFIFQVGEFCDDLYKIAKDKLPSCCPLFDQSAGTGVLPEAWAPCQEFSGFAGGLTPENLPEQIELIAKAAGDYQAWIDVESGVRTNDVFDLQKVRRFLEISEPYVL